VKGGTVVHRIVESDEEKHVSGGIGKQLRGGGEPLFMINLLVGGLAEHHRAGLSLSYRGILQTAPINRAEPGRNVGQKDRIFPRGNTARQTIRGKKDRVYREYAHREGEAYR